MRSWPFAALVFVACGKEAPPPELVAVPLPEPDAGVASSRAGEDPCHAAWKGGDAGSFVGIYQRARIAFESEHYDQAAAGFRVVAFQAGGDMASYASVLYLSSLHELKCLSDIERDVPKLEQLQCAGKIEGVAVGRDGEQCELLARLHLDVERAKAQFMFESGREANDLSKMFHAGEAYEELAERECARSGKLCEELLYNAGVAFLAGGKSDRAKKVLAAFPKGSKLAQELACRMGLDAGC
jgi:hypothetical protein